MKRSWLFILGTALTQLCAEVFRTRWGKVVAIVVAVVLTSVVTGVSFLYREIPSGVNSKKPWRDQPAMLFAKPKGLLVGQRTSLNEIRSFLRQAGLSAERDNPAGHFYVTDDTIEIHPGPRYRPTFRPATIRVEDNRVKEITRLYDYVALPSYDLVPPLITPYFDERRTKRRTLQYDQIPEHLRHAILAIEDHRFYEHNGFDLVRTVKAAYDGLIEWRTPRGTSTLTQQLARELFLTKERSYERKLKEAVIALKLEALLPKRKIFEYYCNHVAMGSSAGFHIAGFAEAADFYLGKDISKIALAEAALLAALPQKPNYLNPHRYPQRAKRRRNVVLRKMLDYRYIVRSQYESASAEPVRAREADIDVTQAPYFVDLVRRRLEQDFDAADLRSQGYSVFTTIDLELQREAVTAVRAGLERLNRAISRQKRFRREEAPEAQAALVALQPGTGEVRALVGGYDYAESQLNRVLAVRQPGSAFKPFVYAAAINTGLTEDRFALTAASTISDESAVFLTAKNEEYSPTNFSGQTHGNVTLREALRDSMNIATVRLAEQIGYREIADLAAEAGMGDRVLPTPAMALGAYEVTPLQLARAYTVFANAGVNASPQLIRSVEDSDGRLLLRTKPDRTRILDPRVAYIVTNMMEDVMNRGTGSHARAQGFHKPAAGKTGTDDDGWFVGFTTNLLCVVWVGFDDNTDLKIEGAKSALPIWTQFMKRAHRIGSYQNPSQFSPACGVVRVSIDPETGVRAGPNCPDRIEEVFIPGTEPERACQKHQPSFWQRALRGFR